jgi:hypothetical protein
MIRRLLILVSTLSLLAGMAPNLRANPILVTIINEFQTAPIPRIELFMLPYRGGRTLSLTGWTLTTSLGTATILPGHTLDTLHYTVIDPDSVSGTLAMNPVADSIVLRDSLGYVQGYARWPDWDGLPGPDAGWSTVNHRWDHWFDLCTGQPLPIPYLDLYWDQDATPTFGQPNNTHPTGSLSGYVRIANGEGVGNATVKAYGDSGCDVVKSLGCKGYNNGIYSMPTLPPGSYRLWAKATGYDTVELALPVIVRPWQYTRADIYLTPSGTEARPGPESVPESGFTLEPCIPNPARNETQIAFSLTAPSKVSLAVYSLSGQRVRTFLNGEEAIGRRVLAWDGRDDSGRALAPGNYFLRLDAGDRTVIRKITLLK